MSIKLSIIIVNWNSLDYLRKCIPSIYADPSLENFEVIVVDNASHDGSEQFLGECFPDARYVQSSVNLGFAKANNLGAAHARGKMLLFLNPDTEVRDGAIERLCGAFQRLPNPGAVGCRLLNSDGTLQTSCVQSFPTVLNQLLDAEVLRQRFPKAHLWGTAPLYADGSAPAEVEAVSGACMMLSHEVFESVGGFDSEFFMYGEDLHLCFKTRQAGFHNYHFGGVEIIHHGGGSTRQLSNSSNAMMHESVYLLLLKSRGKLYSLCYRGTMVGAALCRLLLTVALLPAYRARSKIREWNLSMRKWVTVLRWGLGLENRTDQCVESAENSTLTGRNM